MISTLIHINITHLIDLLLSILVTSPFPESAVVAEGIKNWPV